MLEESGQIESLADDILRRKAHERISEAAIPVDAEGNTIDLTPVTVDEDDDDEPIGDDGQDEDQSPEIEE